jgi:hypothetical protein
MKRIFMALVAAVAIGTTAVAQTDLPQGNQPDKTEMAKKRTERMAEKYGLNDAQQSKLLALNTKYADNMGPMMMGGHRHQGPRPEGGMRQGGDQRRMPEMTEEQRTKMEQHRKERQAAMEAYDKELQDIMTADQFKQYREDMKRRPEGGPRGPRR